MGGSGLITHFSGVTRRGPLVIGWVISWAKYGYKLQKVSIVM